MFSDDHQGRKMLIVILSILILNEQSSDFKDNVDCPFNVEFQKLSIKQIFFDAL